MHYITTVRYPVFPIFADKPATRPAVSISDAATEFGDPNKQNPSTYVYRGEILKAVAHDRRYRPQFNLQINPENSQAIESYRKVSIEQESIGQILDGFI